jgi:hypothetical protein
MSGNQALYEKAMAVAPGQSVPENLVYDTPPPGLSGTSQLSLYTPRTGQTSAPGNIIRFEFTDETSALDFSRAGFFFTVTTSVTGGTYRRFRNLINTIFRQVRILVGTQEILNFMDYNLIVNTIFTASVSEEAYVNIDKEMMGVGSTAERNALATATTTYCMPMFISLLQEKMFPLFALKETLVVEFTLEQPSVCMETDGSAPSYALSNISWMIDQFQPNDTYRNLMKANRLIINFTGCTVVRDTLDTNQLSTDITLKYTCIKHISLFFRNSADVADPAVNDVFTTWNYQAGASWYVRHKGHYHPPQRVNPTGNKEAYFHFLRAVNSWNGFNGGGLNISNYLITFAQFISDKFLLDTNFETFMHAHLLDGKNTSDSSEAITWIMTLTGAPSESQEADYLIWSDQFLVIQNGAATLVY